MDIEGFEWDDAKNETNRKEHGLAFEQAVKAFDDPSAIALEDLEHSGENETRYALVGMIESGLIFVSFTYRNDNCRIISARRASRKMEKMYAEQV